MATVVASRAELKSRAKSHMFELIDELNTEYDRYMHELIEQKRAIAKKIYCDYLSFMQRISGETETTTTGAHQVKCEPLIKQESNQQHDDVDDNFHPAMDEDEEDDDEFDSSESDAETETETPRDPDPKEEQASLCQCQYCSYTTRVPTNLNIHEMRHRGEKPFKCAHCEYRAVTKYEVAAHAKRRHANASSTTQTYVYRPRQNANYTKDAEDGMFHCSVCPYKTVVKQTIANHELRHRGVKPESCKHCSYRAVTKPEVDVHTRRMHPYACAGAAAHVITDDGESTDVQKPDHDAELTSAKEANHFKCSYCEFATRNKYYLREHEMRHCGEKPFKCGHCEYRAVTKHEVQFHARRRHPNLSEDVIHDQRDEKTQTETQAPQITAAAQTAPVASNAVQSNDEIGKEQATVGGDLGQSASKLRKCRFCTYRTMSTTRLGVHEMRHQQQQSQGQSVHSAAAEQMQLSVAQCRYCEYRALTNAEISLHELRAHAEQMKPFKCDKCQKRFALRNHYERHKQNACC